MKHNDFDTLREAKKEHCCAFCGESIVRGTWYAAKWLMSENLSRAHMGCTWVWFAANSVIGRPHDAFLDIEPALALAGGRALDWSGASPWEDFREDEWTSRPADEQARARALVASSGRGDLAVAPTEADPFTGRPTRALPQLAPVGRGRPARPPSRT